MKNRRFFLDVNPKAQEAFESIGDFRYSLVKRDDEMGWDFNIEALGEFIQGLTFSPEELRTLYDILTLEEKEPFDEDEFEYFWLYYHKATGMPKTDKDAAMKYYKKLTKTERGRAYDNVWPYYCSVQDKRFLKKCRTYLKDKNFNDEFIVTNVPSIGKSQSIEDVR
jgi:hypothetical protein